NIYFYTMYFVLSFHFFFSSRRRHTRSKRDWSSDVCSSDLMWPVEFSLAHCFSAVRFPYPEIKYFSMSLANYSRKQEISLKYFLQNQQKIKYGGIYLCTGI